jgi:peroxiredoxin
MIERQTAPAWKIDGDMPNLDAYAGKPVLMFFFNLGCDGCMFRGIPLATEIANKYPEIQVVGVHSNFGAFAETTYANVQAAMAERDVTFPVIMDDGHQTYDAYEAEGTPHWIFIDRDGTVQKSIFGTQPNALMRLEYLLMETFGAEE